MDEWNCTNVALFQRKDLIIDLIQKSIAEFGFPENSLCLLCLPQAHQCTKAEQPLETRSMYWFIKTHKNPTKKAEIKQKTYIIWTIELHAKLMYVTTRLYFCCCLSPAPWKLTFILWILSVWNFCISQQFAISLGERIWFFISWDVLEIPKKETLCFCG